MATDDERRREFGARLRSARTLAGYTLDGVAEALTDHGYKYGKAAISAWEVGRTVPDAMVLAVLGRLFGTTADALLWGGALSMEAVRFGSQFDSLDADQRRAFRGMWNGYVDSTGRELPPPISSDQPTGGGLLGAAERKKRSA